MAHLKNVEITLFNPVSTFGPLWYFCFFVHEVGEQWMASEENGGFLDGLGTFVLSVNCTLSTLSSSVLASLDQQVINLQNNQPKGNDLTLSR